MTIDLEAWLILRKKLLTLALTTNSHHVSKDVGCFINGQLALIDELNCLFISDADAKTPVEAVDEGDKSGC